MRSRAGQDSAEDRQGRRKPAQAYQPPLCATSRITIPRSPDSLRPAAAQGDWKSAIVNMKPRQAATPLPDYAAALYDYYTAAGETKKPRSRKK